MPKERVFSSDQPFTDASSARSVIGVVWSRDNYAQVFTELFNDDLQYTTAAEPGITQTAEGEAAVRRKMHAEGFYVTLDRSGINHLIRHLRRARDQAFGRDE